MTCTGNASKVALQEKLWMVGGQHLDIVTAMCDTANVAGVDVAKRTWNRYTSPDATPAKIRVSATFNGAGRNWQQSTFCSSRRPKEICDRNNLATEQHAAERLPVAVG